MKAPRKPKDERYRLEALASLVLLDTAPEADFDALVHLGNTFFDVPTCLVSLVDARRQWFKAKVGLDARETSRDISFCGHAILQEDVFVVPDAREDKRFHDNPLVVGPPHIRFYAGAPIRLPTGYTIGTFCIISSTPRAAFDREEQAHLRRFADLTLNAIAVRALRGRMDESQALATRYQAALHFAPTPIALADRNGVIVESNGAFAALCGSPPDGSRVHDALAIRRKDWMPDPAGSTDGTPQFVSLKKTGARLRVLQDADGYVLVGA